MIRTLIILLAALPLVGLSQDVVKDLALINSFYANAKSLSLEMTYRMYMSGKGTPDQESNGVFIREGANLFSDMGGVLTVQDGRYRVSLQKDQRLMAVGPTDTTSINSLQGMDLKQLLTKAGDSRYLGERKKLRGYLLGTERLIGSTLKNVEVWFDPNDGHIAIMTMRFREMEIKHTPDLPPGSYTPYAEVIYTSSKRNITVDRSRFETGKYVVEAGGNLHIRSAYSQYELINSMGR